VNKKNFKILIDFLKELPINKFNIVDMVTDYDIDEDCGTVCCAVGWFPAIFPKRCQWQANGDGLIFDGGFHWTYSYMASEILQIPRDHATALFNCEGDYITDYEDLPYCHSDATPLDLVNLLEIYMEKRNGNNQRK
jgi:hypothetical protein